MDQNILQRREPKLRNPVNSPYLLTNEKSLG